MTDIKFVFANPPRFRKKSFIEKFGNIDGRGIPALAIPYLIGYQQENGCTEVKWYVKEFGIEDKDPYDALGEIEDIQPDVVGICGYSKDMRNIYNFSDLIGYLVPKATRVLGGYHATALPEEGLDHFDIVVRGEGLDTLTELIDTLNNGGDFSKIKGISYKENGKNVHNGYRELININDLPFPAWDKTPVHLYPFDKGHGFMMSSFGCKMNCTFCQFPPGSEKRKYREHRIMHPEKVIEHMEGLTRKYNLNNMIIIDDDFLDPEERANEIFKLKQDNKYVSDLKLHITGRADHICKNGVKNETILNNMKSGKVKTNFIGVETTNKHILKKIYNKGEKVGDIKKAIRYCVDNGIDVYASMIISPWDKFSDLLKTARICLPAYICQAPQLTPYPGTILYEKLKEEGKILNEDWDNYDGAHILIKGNSDEQKEMIKAGIYQVLFNLYTNFSPYQIVKNPRITLYKLDKTMKALFK